MKYVNKFIGTVVFSTFILAGCDQETSYEQGEDFGNNAQNEVNTDFDRLALITNLTDNIIAPTFSAFYQQTQLLAPAVASYCATEQAFSNATVTSENVASEKTLAQGEWRTAMDLWQQAELMQMGPLTDNDGALRDNIYSWPVTNACSVDYDTVYFDIDLVNGQPYDITQRTSSRKGLAALEYLLFNEQVLSSCESGNEPAEWNTYSSEEIILARCNFAEAVAQDLENNALTLLTQWQSATGFVNELKQAAVTDINSAQQAVNRISDALFYIDSLTKDWKLARPLALEPFDCATPPCSVDASALESTFSQHSLQNIINNLTAFEKLFTGNGGIGFEAFLNESAGDLTAEEMKSDISQALIQLSNINNSMTATLADDPNTLIESHSDIKKITDNLKNDFINNLALELPATSAGDND